MSATIHNTARWIGGYCLTPKELGITGPCSPDCEWCARVTEWAVEPTSVNYSSNGMDAQPSGADYSQYINA